MTSMVFSHSCSDDIGLSMTYTFDLKYTLLLHVIFDFPNSLLLASRKPVI